MIARVAAALTLLLAGLFLYETVWADADHAEGACFAQSWDQKTGPAEFWWKSATGCNDHPAGVLAFDLQLYRFDWNLWRYYGLAQRYGETQYYESFAGASRYWAVEENGGMYCYRIQTYHFIEEPMKGLSDEGDSYSSGECY